VDAYQRNVRIAEHHVTAQIVVGKSVVVGIILVNQNSTCLQFRIFNSLFFPLYSRWGHGTLAITKHGIPLTGSMSMCIVLGFVKG